VYVAWASADGASKETTEKNIGARVAIRLFKRPPE
jgi:hypothetical protein